MNVKVVHILTTGGMKWKLINEAGQIVRNTPAWKTAYGAARWAVSHGHKAEVMSIFYRPEVTR